jgi:predicted O-methyltransferase YrrM
VSGSPVHPTLEMALELAGAGRVQEAIDALEVVANGDPEAPRRRDALAHRAWALRSLGRFAESAADYERARALNAELGVEDRELWLLHAEALHLGGEFARAAREAANLLARDPLDSSALRALARAQQALQVAPPPRRDAGEALQLEANSPELGRRVFFNPVVEKLHGERAGFPASIFPDVGRLVYAIVRALRPGLALETGSFVGYSALCIAQAMEDNGAGHLHCFDLFGEPRAGYVSPVAGALPTLGDYAQAHLDAAGLSHRTTLHRGDSSTMIRHAFPEESPILDFAFIDGDHLIPGCLKDWRAVDARLKEGGVVLLHDTNARGASWHGPEHLLERLDQRERDNYRWVELPTFDNLGLGLVRKMRPGAARRWRPTLSELIAERIHVRADWRKKRRG